MFLRRVVGQSMEPEFLAGDFVVGWRRGITVGQVVLARQAGREVIKRVEKAQGDKVYLRGDNSTESTDSRHYGPVQKSAIIGSIMTKFRFATAVNPPKLVKPHGLWVGRALAAVMVVMVLVHLFRIDTFVPILDQNLPGGTGWANVFAMLIILSELFAVPFLLRMKLSPLAHIKSGALVVFAPLWWFLITIWSWGMLESTGELGEFVAVYADPFTLLANLVWLGVGYYAIYTLGYNSLKLNLKDTKRKK